MKLKGLILLTLIVISGRIFSQNSSSSADTVSGKNLFDYIIMTDEEKKIFKEYTKQKIEEFQQYIITIGDKSQPEELRNMAEREAVKLFYKGATIEISNVDEKGKTNIVTRPIEKYLARLKALPYTRVIIKYYDIAYISDFIKGPDGKYYSTATIIQEFTGIVGDKIQYTDVTKKEIEVVVDLVEDSFYMERHWKIFLGNIKAVETSQKPDVKM